MPALQARLGSWSAARYQGAAQPTPSGRRWRSVNASCRCQVHSHEPLWADRHDPATEGGLEHRHPAWARHPPHGRTAGTRRAYRPRRESGCDPADAELTARASAAASPPQAARSCLARPTRQSPGVTTGSSGPRPAVCRSEAVSHSRSEEVGHLLNRSEGRRPQALPSPGRERRGDREGKFEHPVIPAWDSPAAR